MVQESPLKYLQEQAGAEFLSYGPISLENAAPSGGPTSATPMVATYGELEAEYAVIRKCAGLLDLPQRGTIEIRGEDRIDFLDRMLTNDMTPLGRGECVRAFLVNRQGRIQADLFAVPDADRVFLDVDLYASESTCEILNAFIFAEDVTIENQSDTWHRLALHGPDSVRLLDQAVEVTSDVALSDLKDHRRGTGQLNGGVPFIIVRHDSAGTPGLELICPATEAVKLHERILEIGLPAGLRAIGWLAYNMARIEAGCPIFLTDFGPGTLPHETGERVLNECVSFTKGCYPGQEVVARMQNLGHPKQTLIGLRVEGDDIPMTGAPVLDSDRDDAETIGAVTSASPSPMLGNAACAFAMMQWAKANIDETVFIDASGTRAAARVHDLQFWKS